MSALRARSTSRTRRQPKHDRALPRRLTLETLEDRNLFAVQVLSLAEPSLLSTSNKQTEIAPVHSVSDNGQFTVFFSTSSNLVANETVNGTTSTENVYLYNAATQTVTLISHDASNPDLEGNKNSFNAVISGDGSTIAFYSSATDLISGQTQSSNTVQLYLYDNNPNDAAYGTLQLVTHTAASTTAAANGKNPSIPGSYGAPYVNTLAYSTEGGGLALPSLSDNGQYVAYISDATNLVTSFTSGGSTYDQRLLL